ncbi:MULTISPECIES: FadR/GntR family transcriptional regulator [unclassified Shewanella]|uniref:FadR/GntR family transcriptional regulator n=1 Tax=unclassified Shewanella TaxID=196818 RepID=UPI000C85789C|nr:MULTISPECIES: FadR/GntR family transcriptional regulator [unclassified Shewanella]MDO6619166.1 FadR/GntR family transcriptional regulator [Shewanella sp. 6_MG-2023]MDO6773926.1 FadR/GntR family transcriptional regulator [Shewanella sp. 3_MG-2023]PMH86551.1 GntR family transcriptional regulator [Shewanella sp. 10N.286.48.B5]
MKNRRMFWRIVEEIEASITRGEYVPGSRLPPERELAEKFDVSRPTIREAIIALEVREKIEVKTGSGVYVLQSVNQSQLKNKINAFELTQARALVEGEIAALAANTITEEELVELNKTLIMMENKSYVEEADQMFHNIIANSTRNGALIKMFESLWALRASSPKIIDDYDSVCSKDNQKTLDEHTAIYEALAAADASEARAAMHKHFNRLINVLFDTVEAKSLEEVKRKNSEKRDLYSIDNLVNRLS